MGLTEDQAKASRASVVEEGPVPGPPSAAPSPTAATQGFTKLLFDDSPEAHGHGSILGGGIVGTHAGDMIRRDCVLAIEMGADAVTSARPSTRHPTLGESIGIGGRGGAWHLAPTPPARK